MGTRILSWVFIMSFFGSGPALAAEGCTLNQVLGDVRVIRDGQTSMAKANDALKKGDALETGPDCMVDMSMNDLAGCRMLASSRMEVTGWKPENMSLSVSEGNVILNLKKLPEGSSFKLETPAAVASVRGTQFWGRVDGQKPENPVTTFAVREGEIQVLDKASSRIFSLKKGEALDIPKNGKTSPSVRLALPGEMQAMEQSDEIHTQTDGELLPFLN